MSYKSECLQRGLDIEPLCRDFFPEEAIAIAEQMLSGEKEPTIICALGLIIPSQEDPNKILYAQRDPKTNDEFPNAWGLPSISITQPELLTLADGNGGMLMEQSKPLINRISNRKLEDISLIPGKFQAWTGRFRSESDKRFKHTYYLIMVDILTQSINPNLLPQNTQLYSNFTWLTPKEHKQLVSEADNQACGACSQITHLLSESGNI